MPGFQLLTVPQKGWSKTKNGALLRLAESAGFDAFLTADQSLQYQQNLQYPSCELSCLLRRRTEWSTLVRCFHKQWRRYAKWYPVSCASSAAAANFGVKLMRPGFGPAAELPASSRARRRHGGCSSPLGSLNVIGGNRRAASASARATGRTAYTKDVGRPKPQPA
jgi:hypothetical protein